MSKFLKAAYLAAPLLAMCAAVDRAHAVTSTCAGLAGVSFPDTTISQAALVDAGAVIGGTTVPVDICRVVATVSTKPGEAVGIEVWMPTFAWNGRFEGLGSGGFGGSITYSELAPSVARGFAAANTDTGHEGGSVGAIGQTLPWAQNKVTLRDWGHSSIHLMTRAAKAIVKAYYGKPAAYAYYDGCSTGGAEGMEEAEFYPDDYDGIHAGSPGMDYSHLMMSFLWGGLLPAQNPAATLGSTELALLSNAVLQSCGGDRAVADGFLDYPRACTYDPAKLICSNGQTSGCLTAEQVAEAQALYSAVRDPVNGLILYPGFARGSEINWSLIQGALVPYYAQPLLANAVYDNPNWDWTTFNFNSDAFLVDRKLSPDINATSPNLTALRTHGGKLIMTQGWADALNAQTLPIEYYDSVVITDGSVKLTQTYFRLFMVPGMSHCGGGPGPDTIGGNQPPVAINAQRDVLTALQAWVEQGQAPDSFIATKYANDNPADGVALERTICAYPQNAKYTGSGSRNDAKNWVCKSDEKTFASDLSTEQQKMATDAAYGDVQNLPN